MFARFLCVSSFTLTVAQAPQSSVDYVNPCANLDNEQSCDQSYLMQTDLRSLLTRKRPEGTQGATLLDSQSLASSGASPSESQDSGTLLGRLSDLASHLSPWPLQQDTGVQHQPLSSAQPPQASSLQLDSKLQHQAEGQPRQADPVPQASTIQYHATSEAQFQPLSPATLSTGKSQVYAEPAEDVEEQSVLSTQVQLSTALKRVEEGLNDAQAMQLQESSQDKTAAQLLAESAREVRASQRSADEQMAYTAQMSEFLETAAKQSEDAHFEQESMVAREEKARQLLERALQQVQTAAGMANSQNSQVLQGVLVDALKAQDDVVAGAAQQEQATSNMNKALHNAAQAAMKSEAFSQLQISPSLQNMSRNIGLLQSSTLQHVKTEKKVAETVEGAAQNVAQAESAVGSVQHTWQHAKRKVQSMEGMVHSMEGKVQESAKIVEEERHNTYLLQQAQQKIKDDQARAAQELELAEDTKSQAANLAQAAKQNEAFAEKTIEDNIQSLTKARSEVAEALKFVRHSISSKADPSSGLSTGSMGHSSGNRIQEAVPLGQTAEFAGQLPRSRIDMASTQMQYGQPIPGPAMTVQSPVAAMQVQPPPGPAMTAQSPVAAMQVQPPMAAMYAQSPTFATQEGMSFGSTMTMQSPLASVQSPIVATQVQSPLAAVQSPIVATQVQSPMAATQGLQHMQVVVPEGMSPGQIMTVLSPAGQQMQVVVPNGVYPGSTIMVQLP